MATYVFILEVVALTYSTDGLGEILLTRELAEIFLANQVLPLTYKQ